MIDDFNSYIDALSNGGLSAEQLKEMTEEVERINRFTSAKVHDFEQEKQWRAEQAPEQKPPNGILSGEAFMAQHAPPDWLIDGIVQRSRLYACTSLTGHGKTAVWLFNACMVQAGRMIGKMDVQQGNVLILAGENPADLSGRMLGMCREFKIPHRLAPFVLPGNFPLSEQGLERLMERIKELGVPLSLILGDTAASFFPGDEENSNVQNGGYARRLRRLCDECHGLPTVVMNCHPAKNATKYDLMPRGGGAFLNELDGNLTLWADAPGEQTTLHWQHKIRGPEFAGVPYSLRVIATGMQDRRGRDERTVVAEPVSEESATNHSQQTLANQDAVLRTLQEHPDWSLAQRANHAGWVNEGGEPMKAKVQRAIAALAHDKLISKPRENGKWILTAKGRDALK